MEKNEENGSGRILYRRKWLGSSSVVTHIARHAVFPDEVEDVAFDDAPWIRKGKKGTRYMTLLIY